MITVKKRFEFCAAHYLPNHLGACGSLHGHNFVIEVEITGPIQQEGPSAGMVMDFADLKKIVWENFIVSVDHTCLNDSWINPTAETIVQGWAELLEKTLPIGIHLISLTLWETSTSSVVWRSE